MTAVWSTNRMVATWAVGVVCAGVLAVLVTVVGFLAMRPAPGTAQGFEELGAGIAGALLGALVAALGWLVLLVVVIRRYMPGGRRLAAGAASVGAVAVVSLLAYALAAAAHLDRGLGAAAAALQAAMVGGAVAPPLVLVAFTRRAEAAAHRG